MYALSKTCRNHKMQDASTWRHSIWMYSMPPIWAYSMNSSSYVAALCMRVQLMRAAADRQRGTKSEGERGRRYLWVQSRALRSLSTRPGVKGAHSCGLGMLFALFF